MRYLLSIKTVFPRPGRKVWSTISVKFIARFLNLLAPPENVIERRYALRAVKQRLHQASFREAVIAAYDGRCAVSALPESLLLDAAHIVADKDEQFGQPVVPVTVGADSDRTDPNFLP